MQRLFKLKIKCLFFEKSFSGKRMVDNSGRKHLQIDCERGGGAEDKTLESKDNKTTVFVGPSFSDRIDMVLKKLKNVFDGESLTI